MKKFIFLHIIFLLSSFSFFSQVEFNAKLSKNSLGLNERLKIEFSIDKDGDNFTPPSFENFRIVGGPSQSIRNSWVNGKRSYAKTYSYFLSPIKKGSFVIGQASIEVDGKIYKTSPVNINVSSSVDKPVDTNDPDYIINNTIHLVAEVSNKNPFLNEAISVTYKLYVSPDTGVDNWRELDAPRYANFWSNNIDIKTLNVENGTFKGQPYRYVILRKALLYPQKTGKLKIEPLTLDVSVQVPSNRRDFFGQLFTSSVNKSVASGTSFINVKPLPANNKPNDFSGAVGEFDYKLISNKEKLVLDEAFQLSLVVSGKGNFNLFDEPTVKLSSSLEVYQPEKEEKFSTNISGINGKLTNVYTIVPSSVGKFTIPQTRFTYFNPKSEKYSTIFSDPIFIDVEGDLEKKSLSNQNSQILEKTNNIKLLKNQFSSFKTKTKFSRINKKPFFNSYYFWITLFVPFIFCFLIVLVVKYLNYYKYRKVDEFEKSKKLAYKLLESSRALIGNKQKFYESLEIALITYLKAKLNIENSDLNKDEINIKLKQLKVKENSINLLKQVFENCQLARYTPINVDTMNEDYEKAKSFIENIENRNHEN